MVNATNVVDATSLAAWSAVRNAHHLSPGVPLYNLPHMTRLLEEQGTLEKWRFT